MAIAFRSKGNLAWAAGHANTTIPAPAGIVDGDILLAFIEMGDFAGPAITGAPSGWTALAGSPLLWSEADAWKSKMYAYWKRASSESGSYVWTHNGTTNTEGCILCYSGAKASGDPFSVTPTKNNSAGTTSTYTGLTTTVDGTMIVLASAAWDAGVGQTPPSGTTPTFTERNDTTLMYLADGILATAGATGDKTQTNNNNSGGDYWGTWMIALDPATAAATSPRSCINRTQQGMQ